jgi:hypothetical protein
MRHETTHLLQSDTFNPTPQKAKDLTAAPLENAPNRPQLLETARRQPRLKNKPRHNPGIVSVTASPDM